MKRMVTHSLPGKQVLETWLVFRRIAEDQPRRVPLGVTSRNLVFDNCSKNFVYYTLHQLNKFPRINRIFLRSHPCEPCILQQFSDLKTQLYLHESFQTHKYLWAKDIPNIQLITERDYRRVLKAIEL